MTPRAHGGPDALGISRWDFSSNANACGPCPMALKAVQQADAAHYPDPAYTRLRSALAHLHGVDPARVWLAASASEGIQRITAWRWRAGDRRFWTPPHAYGDYEQAASAWGLARATVPDQARLAWLCDPGSPLGQGESVDAVRALLNDTPRTVVLDRAYAPLRLQGVSALTDGQLDRVWQLWSPNKALGLTGVRAAYAVAPLGAQADVAALEALAASWPIGAHGEAMLMAWAQPEVQHWVAASRSRLAEWVGALRVMMARHGWICAPSDTAYGCARPLQPLNAVALRARGIKLRDATSFGLPGWWRLSAQRPEALAALDAALDELHGETSR
ncbi:MAG TPA: aminotransferase class I/II-fold pyridoxal phosphate-dependent enzyme [Hydrogenophaga sp.]|uniref:aminotransferase class I/II-fold pyridoxal phosphate-dependent enzyme n=1 Tax=Hydrogenophaga sp. TaxID=1904254 RepID=UPI002BA9E1A5|nr:aminotransferase class I/II-fold pyridoxal phosphate-dependent enzyme [Hydrogenophaga sp.]HMN92327.1 aminotransferase class I/II-fold pyridoxal phosphate-dependent enzyme [Hydrogenophaga sp.]HMP11786.1 aminotransferase class I/II-fold pyridoxal phosphate-dependent enzyme [Hydrogenophaga sp.]